MKPGRKKEPALDCAMIFGPSVPFDRLLWQRQRVTWYFKGKMVKSTCIGLLVNTAVQPLRWTDRDTLQGLEGT
jgi:hypothetical protein